MKTYKVYLMPDAIKDLEHIYEYICTQSGFPERVMCLSQEHNIRQ